MKRRYRIVALVVIAENRIVKDIPEPDPVEKEEKKSGESETVFA